MIKTNFIKNLFSRLCYGNCINPVRDWFILLVISAIALVCIIVWNVWVFGTVAQGGVIGSTATSSPPVFNNSSLDMVRSVFLNRYLEEEKYETGIYSFVDPSQ